MRIDQNIHLHIYIYYAMRINQHIHLHIYIYYAMRIDVMYVPCGGAWCQVLGHTTATISFSMLRFLCAEPTEFFSHIPCNEN